MKRIRVSSECSTCYPGVNLRARRYPNLDLALKAVNRLRIWRPVISHVMRIRWRSTAGERSAMRNLHDGAKLEYANLGGWTAFKSGEWLWLLIQKSFINYWERATVESFWAKYGTTDPEKIAAKLIADAATNAAILGGVTGAAVSTDEIVAIMTVAEGGIGLPANLAIAASAISAEAILLVGFQLQLVANLGKLYGVPLHPTEPVDILTILAFAFGGAAAEAAGKAGMKVGGKLASREAETVFADDVSGFLERIGLKVGIKIFQRTIMKYVNPLSSIGIGTGWNYLATRKVGKIAIEHFKKRIADLDSKHRNA